MPYNGPAVDGGGVRLMRCRRWSSFSSIGDRTSVDAGAALDRQYHGSKPLIWMQSLCLRYGGSVAPERTEGLVDHTVQIASATLAWLSCSTLPQLAVIVSGYPSTALEGHPTCDHEGLADNNDDDVRGTNKGSTSRKEKRRAWPGDTGPPT